MVLLHVERQDARPVFTCEVDKVPKKAEAALRYKLNVAAQSACGAYIKAFAECCSDKTLSVVFACRPQLNEMNACLKRWKTDAQLLHFKEQWVAARCPEQGFEPTLNPSLAPPAEEKQKS